MYVILSRNNCSFCAAAKATLERHKLPYEDIDIEHNDDFRKFLRLNGLKTVPQIFTDGDRIGGYEELMQRVGGG